MTLSATSSPSATFTRSLVVTSDDVSRSEVIIWSLNSTFLELTRSPMSVVAAGCINFTSPSIASGVSAAYVTFRVVVEVYLVGALCFAGLLGNALSIAVLYRDRRDDDKRNTTNWLLQALAIVDTLYLASCVAIQSAKTVHDLTDWAPGKSLLRRSFPYVEPHAWALASIAQTSTVWLVLLVTVDRYLAVCHPWHTEWRTKSRAKMAVIIVVTVAAVYNIPRFFERKIVYDTDCVTGEPIVRSQKTTFRDNLIYFVVYKTICYLCFRSVGPLVALVALNVRLVRALQSVRRRRRDMAGRRFAVTASTTLATTTPGSTTLHAAISDRQKQRPYVKARRRREGLTLMLVTVVTVFVVCELPDLGLRIAFTMSEAGYVKLDVVRLRWANVISNALLTVNSSVNFLIYCLVGNKFRRILGRMCCPRRWRLDVAASTAATTAGGVAGPGCGGGDVATTERLDGGGDIEAECGTRRQSRSEMVSETELITNSMTLRPTNVRCHSYPDQPHQQQLQQQTRGGRNMQCRLPLLSKQQHMSSSSPLATRHSTKDVASSWSASTRYDRVSTVFAALKRTSSVC